MLELLPQIKHLYPCAVSVQLAYALLAGGGRLADRECVLLVGLLAEARSQFAGAREFVSAFLRIDSRYLREEEFVRMQRLTGLVLFVLRFALEWSRWPEASSGSTEIREELARQICGFLDEYGESQEFVARALPKVLSPQELLQLGREIVGIDGRRLANQVPVEVPSLDSTTDLIKFNLSGIVSLTAVCLASFVANAALIALALRSRLFVRFLALMDEFVVDQNTQFCVSAALFAVCRHYRELGALVQAAPQFPETLLAYLRLRNLATLAALPVFRGLRLLLQNRPSDYQYFAPAAERVQEIHEFFFPGSAPPRDAGLSAIEEIRPVEHSRHSSYQDEALDLDQSQLRVEDLAFLDELRDKDERDAPDFERALQQHLQQQPPPTYNANQHSRQDQAMYELLKKETQTMVRFFALVAERERLRERRALQRREVGAGRAIAGTISDKTFREQLRFDRLQKTVEAEGAFIAPETQQKTRLPTFKYAMEYKNPLQHLPQHLLMSPYDVFQHQNNAQYVVSEPALRRPNRDSGSRTPNIDNLTLLGYSQFQRAGLSVLNPNLSQYQ